jgi:hypothetical protein
MFPKPDRNPRYRDAELADQWQQRREREARCRQEIRERRVRLDLEKREREAKLVVGSWREGILLGMTVICFMFAIGFLLAGLQTEEVYAFGGSGTFGAMSSLLLHLLRAS